MTLELLDAQNNVVASDEVKGSGNVSATLQLNNPNKWTAETPYLYTLRATLKNGNTISEVVPVKVTEKRKYCQRSGSRKGRFPQD